MGSACTGGPRSGRGAGRGVADSAGPTEDLLIALSNFTHDSEYGRKLHSAPRERGEGAGQEADGLLGVHRDPHRAVADWFHGERQVEKAPHDVDVRLGVR